MLSVDIFWNTRRNVYSMRFSGKVYAWGSRILLARPQFIVSDSGRERVRQNKVKEVHAIVRGVVSEWEGEVRPVEVPKDIATVLDQHHHVRSVSRDLTFTRSVYYNPYHDETFMAQPIDGGTPKPIYDAGYVLLAMDEWDRPRVQVT